MARATGADFKLYGLKEATLGTAPSGNWNQWPCKSFTLGASQDSETSEYLSTSSTRSGSFVAHQPRRVAGNAVVPVDTVHFGRWLRHLLGPATTTGSTNYTHTFKDGGALGSLAFEKAFAGITRYELFTGVHVNSMSVGIGLTGKAEATFEMMGLNEADDSVSGAGTPVVAAFEVFDRVSGSIERDDTVVGGVVGGSLTVTNNLATYDALRSDYLTEGIDVGMTRVSGELQILFQNHTFRTLALARTAIKLEYILAISATKKITFELPQCYLMPRANPVDGPGGITQTFGVAAEYKSASAGALVVTYLNQTSTYT